MARRIFFIVPSVEEYSAMAINELQLALALSQFAKVYVFGFKEIHCAAYYRNGEHRNITIMCFSTLRGVTTFFYPIFSAILSSIASLLTALGMLDQIYCRDSLLALCFLFSKSIASKTTVKIPSILEDEERNSALSKIVSLVYGVTDKMSIRKAGHIAVTTNNSAKALFVRRGAKSQSPPIMIPAGVDLNLINAIKTVKKTENQKDSFRVGFVGSLCWWQGLELLIQALALIKHDVDLIIEFYLVGDGPQRKEIEKECKKKGLEYTITGFVPHVRALELLSSFDLLVVPSLKKTSASENNIPIKVVEAWALGVPVIITAHPVFKDNFRDGVDILLCEENAEDMAKKIVSALVDPSLRNRLSLQGTNLARNFSYQTLAERLLAV